MQIAKPVLDVAMRRLGGKWTDIQEKAIPVIASGKDVLVIAPTGLGKTETAFLPVLSKIYEMQEAHKVEMAKNPDRFPVELVEEANKSAKSTKTAKKVKQKGFVASANDARTFGGELPGIVALYITPLRALNRDLMLRLSSWCDELGITISVRHGDTTTSVRQKQRDNPPQILITTPETFQSLLIAPKLSDSLANLRFVIIDEVHELFDSKRGTQLSLGLERLAERNKQFQRIGISATVGSRDEIAKFISPNAQICAATVIKKPDISVSLFAPRSVGQRNIPVQGALHAGALARAKEIEHLIKTHNSSLIFVNTRYVAESLSNSLLNFPSLKSALGVHHSSLSKETRTDIEDRFKAGQLKSIVCTSSLELGIDIGSIDLVVQYGSPHQVTRLLQRIGRSGHKHYLNSKGSILALDELDCMEALAICMQATQGQIEPQKSFTGSLDVLGHFIAGVALDKYSISLEMIYDIAKRSYCYSDLDRGEFLNVVNQMNGVGVVRVGIVKDANDKVNWQSSFVESKGTRTRLYYYENISTIPDEKKFFVKNASSRKNIGVLDEAFVSEYLQSGTTFISQGRPWKVLSIIDREIVVEEAHDMTAAIPDWVGEEIPVTHATSQLVGSLFARDNIELAKKFCSQAEIDALTDYAKQQSNYFLPGKHLFVEAVASSDKPLVVIHSFNGLKANETLGRVLSFLLASRDKSLRTRSTPYAIVLEFSRPVTAGEVAKTLNELTPEHVQSILSSALPTTSAFKNRFSHVAKRFGFISRNWDARATSLTRIINALPPTNPMISEVFNEMLHASLSMGEVNEIIRDIRTGRSKVQAIEKETWSPLAKNALEHGGLGELFMPAEPTSAILDSFSKTIKEKTAKLYCTYCKNGFSVLLSEIKMDDAIKCPNCASTALTYEDRIDAESDKEKLEMEKISALIAAYGGRALFALETYGVGPATAIRILARMHRLENDLFYDLLQAQKTFVKNSKYWKL